MAWEDLINSTLTPERYPRPSGGSRGRVDAGYVIDGLVKRGMARHIAEGFAMNFSDESNFDPGINERNPIVAGSRGGYGLYQLTGPRRRAYEAFAAQRGVDYSNPDAQLDFLMWELGNTERRAASKIFSSRSAGEAGAAIVNHFLRPAEKHRAHRAQKYLGGQTPQYSPTEQGPNRLWLDLTPSPSVEQGEPNRLWLA